MYKALLAAMLMVTGVPLVAVSISEDEPAAPDRSPHEGVHVSEDGHQIVLTDEALPADTGFVLLTLAANEPTAVGLDETLELNGSAGDTATATVWKRPWMPAPAIWMRDHGYDTVEAGHEGVEAECCPSTPGGLFTGSSGASQHSFHVGPGETLTYGLIVQDWPMDGHYKAVFESRDASLTVAAVQTGTEVTFLDLVDEAYAQGTGAQLGDQPIAGEPGDVVRTFDADGNAVVAIDSWVHGRAQGKLSLSLANGTTIDNGNGRNVSLHATGALGDAPFEVRFTDVHRTSFTEQFTGTVQGIATGEPGEGTYDHLMARLLVADLPLSGTSMHTDIDSTLEPNLPDRPGAITLETGELPGPTGWFVARIEADQEARVDVGIQVNTTDEPPRLAQPLVLEAHHPDAYADVRTQRDLLGLHHEGTSATCCPGLDEGRFMTGWSDTWVRDAWIPAGEPLYVGFLADGFEDDEFTIRVLPNATESPDATLVLAGISQGSTVHAIDLLERSREHGTTASALGASATFQPADVHETFTTEHATLVALEAYFEGDTQGKLALSLPDGTSVENGDGRDIQTYVSGVTDPGDLRVDLTDVQLPDRLDHMQGADAWAEARLVVADIELPLRGLDVYQDQA